MSTGLGNNHANLLKHAQLTHNGHACKDSISAALNCSRSEMEGMDGMEGMAMKMKKRSDEVMAKRMSSMEGDGSGAEFPSGDGWAVISPTPLCKTENDFYLQTLALCMHTRCPDVGVADLELFWVMNVAGRLMEQPVPKQSYSVSLAAATSANASRELHNSAVLDYAAVVTDKQWIPNYNADTNFEWVEVNHSKYGLVLFLSGTVIPIGFSLLLRLLPWPATWVTRANALLVDSPLLGKRHA